MRRAAKTISSTRSRCWIQISTVDEINIAADRQKFMTLTGELSWQRLIGSAVPGIWLCPPKFKWFTWQPRPISGMPYHPRASNCYRQSTDQIWSLYLHSVRRYRHERRHKMSKMGWFGVVSITQGQILVANCRFNLPHLQLAPPLEFCQNLWHQKPRRIALSQGIKISPVGSLD